MLRISSAQCVSIRLLFDVIQKLGIVFQSRKLVCGQHMRTVTLQIYLLGVRRAYIWESEAVFFGSDQTIRCRFDAWFFGGQLNLDHVA